MVSKFSEMYTFVFNYVKILDDIHFSVICFVIVFYTSILRNVFSLIGLNYNKCFNNMFSFFSNYTYIFQQLQLQHHCMFLYKHGAKPLLILFVGHFYPPLFLFSLLSISIMMFVDSKPTRIPDTIS